jgi:hypothetical protein
MSGSLNVNSSDLGTVSAKLKFMFKKRNSIKCMSVLALELIGSTSIFSNLASLGATACWPVLNISRRGKEKFWIAREIVPTAKRININPVFISEMINISGFTCKVYTKTLCSRCLLSSHPVCMYTVHIQWMSNISRLFVIDE